MHILKRIKIDFNKMLLLATSLVAIGAFLFTGLAWGEAIGGYLRPLAAVNRDFQGGETTDSNTNLKHVALRNNIAFAHSILPYYVPGTNSLLEEGTDWVTKLKVLLSFSPIVCSSTLQKGDGLKNMWGAMGVFLCEGKIVRAYPRDGGTVAEGIWSLAEKQEDVADNVQKAINMRDINRHNQIDVDEPQIAGFYVCREKEFRRIQTVVPDEEIYLGLQSLGVSAMLRFVIQNGKFYRAHYDPSTRTIISDEEIEPSQILEDRFQLSETEIRRMQQEVLENPPFRAEAIGSDKTTQEVRCIDARDFGGRHAYIALNIRKYQKKGIVAQFATRLSKQVEYFVEKNMLNERRYDRFTGKVWIFANSFGEGAIREPSLGRPIRDNKNYFSEIQREIDESRANGYKDYVEMLAFHLYGFAQQAADLGDAENYKKAAAIASQIVSEERYRDVVQRRIGKAGQFILTMQDLDKSFGEVSSVVSVLGIRPNVFLNQV